MQGQIRDVRGFTLTELAVVFAIVALLIGGAMMTLSAQIETRDREETRRRLEAAVDAILGYAVVNRRLPCPAIAGATGDEALATGTAATGGQCTSNYSGFLPARSIGFQPVDGQGYGVDAWGNRIRYVVAATLDASAANCTAPTLPHFTSVANLKANGVACRPGDIDLCTTATGTTATSCNTAARVVTSNTVALIVFSTGKNGSIAAGQGPDETANTDGDRVFVSRLPGTIETGGGAYDDIMVWVPVGVLYSKLIAAGVLP
jgi:type II secretory pathway pseudopilin PulG